MKILYTTLNMDSMEVTFCIHFNTNEFVLSTVSKRV
jgi:hypothetical protein